MTEILEARTRRRWITMGEIIGIAALVISGLSYWDAHQERVAPPRSAAAVPTRASPLYLTGPTTPAHDRIDLRSASPDMVIQTQTIRFPRAVRADPVETTGNPRIEVAWFEDGLRAALKGTSAHASRKQIRGGAGRQRLAVGVETTYVANGAPRTDRSVYDLNYTLRERMLRPDVVEIEGFALVQRVNGDLQHAVDARFAGQVPKPE